MAPGGYYKRIIGCILYCTYKHTRPEGCRKCAELLIFVEPTTSRGFRLGV
jgi:hypothetical protein